MDIHERLKAARQHANFASPTEAAESLGVKYSTYAGHENGSSGFRADTGELYARRFKVRFEWLMRGTGPMIDLSAKHREILDDYEHLPPALQASYADVLRKLAAPYKSQEPDPKEAPAAPEAAE